MLRWNSAIRWTGLVVALAAFSNSTAFAQRQVNDSGSGYVGNAIPGNQFRLRIDSAFGADFPDRAEFLYGAWKRPGPGGTLRNGPGPGGGETRVDYQDFRAYTEFSPVERFSVFGELPVRFLNPEVNPNTAGVADINFGFKWAFVDSDSTLASLQLRMIAPTGDSARGLGTDHFSIEPGLLVFHQFGERWTLEWEVREWIPLDATDGHAGEVVRYGVAGSCLAFQNESVSIRPVVELVGWSVIQGKKTSQNRTLLNAGGDTIVNAKVGVRIGLGCSNDCPVNRHSLYIGYGRALTREVWYDDVLRVEYRLTF